MNRPRRLRTELVQSPLETYLREINETALLTADQEKSLARQIASRSQAPTMACDQPVSSCADASGTQDASRPAMKSVC